MIDATVLPVTPADFSLPTLPVASVRWSALKRFGFRFACCYLLIAVVTVAGVVALLPVVGDTMENWIEFLWLQPVQWLAQHWFHVSGIAAHPHAADSRDTALEWIRTGWNVLVALLGAAVWSVLDRRRLEYRTAAAFLRFALRLTLVLLMFRYGLMKLFPLQMPPPSLAVLNEPVGDTSPLTLLWTLIGLHPGYEMICGAIETAAAVLLFFRRTALLGALLTAFVLTNVLLYNLFFDVPVKLGAANMLLLACAVIVPDGQALYQFFWQGRAVAPTGIWIPPAERRAFRMGTRAVELVFLFVVLLRFVPGFSQAWRQEEVSLRNPSPLAGEWRVDSALLTVGGNKVSRPVLTGEGLPMTALFLEPSGLVMARSSDGRLWRAQVVVDMKAHTMALGSGYFDGERFDATYQMEQPDSGHLILLPTGKQASTNGTLHLTRVALPAHYPLLDHQFHWVNEWGVWR